MFPPLIYILLIVKPTVPAQSSYFRMTCKNYIQGASKLDVVIWHSCTIIMLTWRYMEEYCTHVLVILRFSKLLCIGC